MLMFVHCRIALSEQRNEENEILTGRKLKLAGSKTL